VNASAISRSSSTVPISSSAICSIWFCSSGSSAGTVAWAIRSSKLSATRRCWVPSCRSRSMRRRVASAATTIRAREAVSAAWASALAIAVPMSSVEAGQPRLGVGRQRFPAGGCHEHDAPQPPVDADRTPTDARMPQLSGALGSCTRGRRRSCRSGRAGRSGNTSVLTFRPPKPTRVPMGRVLPTPRPPLSRRSGSKRLIDPWVVPSSRAASSVTAASYLLRPGRPRHQRLPPDGAPPARQRTRAAPFAPGRWRSRWR